MAGVPLTLMEEALGIKLIRIMPSGPDTIKEKKGIIAVYPQNGILAYFSLFFRLPDL